MDENKWINSQPKYLNMDTVTVIFPNKWVRERVQNWENMNLLLNIVVVEDFPTVKSQIKRKYSWEVLVQVQRINKNAFWPHVVYILFKKEAIHLSTSVPSCALAMGLAVRLILQAYSIKKTSKCRQRCSLLSIR